MRKNLFYTVALLLSGSVMTACSGGDDVTSDVTPVPQPVAEASDVVVLSGTLGSKGSVTRAIDADGKGTWEKDDQFAIYYETSNGHESAVATVNNVNEDGSADFTATLESPKTGDNVVTLVYPATAHDGHGGFKTDALMSQDGTLEYINANGLDIETASTTMNVEGVTAKLRSNVTLQPQVCLYKMTLRKDGHNDMENAELLEIFDGTHSYTITPASPTQYFTVALLPVSHADFMFRAISSEYVGPGCLYTKLIGKTLANCTSDNVGDVFDEDGNIYAASPGSGITYIKSFSNITLESGKFYSQNLQLSLIKRPAGIIAYVGDHGSVDSSSPSTETGYRGIALAMQNSTNSNTKPSNNWDSEGWTGSRWCRQNSEACTSQTSDDVTVAREWKNGITMTKDLAEHTTHRHYAARTARNYNMNNYKNGDEFYFSNSESMSRPSGTSNWFLPSVGQWELIVWGLVSKHTGAAYSTPITNVDNDDMKFEKYNYILSNAGADVLISNCNCYWASSEYDNVNAWCMSCTGRANYVSKNNSYNGKIRAVLAF